MKIGYLITARMKSTRLPKKVTKKILGREVIRWMIDRLKLNTEIDEIILCTSTNKQDDILEKIALEENIKIFRGSEDDVIKRLYDASIFFNLDYAINITADCPLVSYKYISSIIETYRETDADLVRALDLPHGFFSYGLKIAAMKKVCDIKKGSNTEVWGTYFVDSGYFNVVDLEIAEDLKRPDYRLTLDYPDDFTFFEHIYKHFGMETYKKSMVEILDYLDNHKDVVAINKHCAELFKTRWESQNKMDLK